MKIIKQIPNLLTLCNLVCGVLGIIFALNTQSLVADNNDNVMHLYPTESLAFSCIFIFIAAVFDFADGLAARALKADSPMGVQLDSLADMVTFGVFPGIIYFKLLMLATVSSSDSLREPNVLRYVALLIPVAACWRLARFNNDEEQQKNFLGLPSPASGLFAACLPLIFHFNTLNIGSLILNKWILLALIIVFSYLMISKITMFKLKLNGMKWKGNEILFSFLLVAVTLIVLFHFAGVAASILLYIILSSVLSLIEESKEIE